MSSPGTPRRADVRTPCVRAERRTAAAWAALGGAPLVGAFVAVAGLVLIEVLCRWRRPFLRGKVPRAGVEGLAEDLVVLDNHLRQTERLAQEVHGGTRPRPDLIIWPGNASDRGRRRAEQREQRDAERPEHRDHQRRLDRVATGPARLRTTFRRRDPGEREVMQQRNTESQLTSALRWPPQRRQR